MQQIENVGDLELLFGEMAKACVPTGIFDHPSAT
jgi:hypothetical protein